MSDQAPAPAAPADGDRLKAFVKDQVEACKVARTEAEAPNHQRRLDACYLAMRYLDDLNGGPTAPTRSAT